MRRGAVLALALSLALALLSRPSLGKGGTAEVRCVAPVEGRVFDVANQTVYRGWEVRGLECSLGEGSVSLFEPSTCFTNRTSPGPLYYWEGLGEEVAGSGYQAESRVVNESAAAIAIEVENASRTLANVLSLRVATPFEDEALVVGFELHFWASALVEGEGFAFAVLHPRSGWSLYAEGGGFAPSPLVRGFEEALPMTLTKRLLHYGIVLLEWSARYGAGEVDEIVFAFGFVEGASGRAEVVLSRVEVIYYVGAGWSVAVWNTNATARAGNEFVVELPERFKVPYLVMKYDPPVGGPLFRASIRVNATVHLAKELPAEDLGTWPRSVRVAWDETGAPEGYSLDDPALVVEGFGPASMLLVNDTAAPPGTFRSEGGDLVVERSAFTATLGSRAGSFVVVAVAREPLAEAFPWVVAASMVGALALAAASFKRAFPYIWSALCRVVRRLWR